MKHLLLILFFLPAWLAAQDDSPYLAGAVPVEDGRVVFSREIQAPALGRQQLYDTLLAWAQKRFSEENNRILYNNDKEGDIACNGEEYLVFSQSFLSLDRTRITYRVTMECMPGKCRMAISGIRYSYNVSYQKEPESYTAENWITDEAALNKKKTKLLRGNGKFRKKTVDLANQLFAEAESALGVRTAGAFPAPATPTAPAAPVAPAAATVSAANGGNSVSLPASGAAALSGYKSIEPDKIPGNIIKMLADDWMLITAGNSAKFNMMTAGWGGLGRLFDKPVAFCFIAPGSYTGQLMENSDTYTLSFYTEAYREALKICGTRSGRDTDKVEATGLTPVVTPDGSPAFSEAWMIIECRKVAAQSLTPEALADPRVKEKWSGKPLHKMYIGEIFRVWVK